MTLQPIIEALQTALMLILFAVNTPNLPVDIQTQVIQVADSTYQQAITAISQVTYVTTTQPVGAIQPSLTPETPPPPSTTIISEGLELPPLIEVTPYSGALWAFHVVSNQPIYTQSVSLTANGNTRVIRAIPFGTGQIIEEGVSLYTYEISLCMDTAELPVDPVRTGTDYNTFFDKPCGGLLSVDGGIARYVLTFTTYNDVPYTTDVLQK